MKATAVAPANVGLIKYWGRKNEEFRLPENGSISMNLSNLLTTTTVEFNTDQKEDEVIINNTKNKEANSRVSNHLERIRKIANTALKARVVSANNFPSSTGLSSSSSAFAALSLAGTKAAGLDLSEKELSILARQGSGSACRSIPDGFVEWLDGDTGDTSYAVSLHPPDYWDIADVVAIVSTDIKDVSSSEGQKLVKTSPFFETRLSLIDQKIKNIKKILEEKNFNAFGELVEAEALELHTIMFTSNPSLIYWTCKTLEIMKKIKEWRRDGLPAYFTINTGQDIHLFCEKKNEIRLTTELKKISEVKDIIINYPAVGARITDKHLF